MRINSIIHLTVIVMTAIIAVFSGAEATVSLGSFTLTGTAALIVSGWLKWFVIVGLYEFLTVVGEHMYQGFKAMVKK